MKFRNFAENALKSAGDDDAKAQTALRIDDSSGYAADAAGESKSAGRDSFSNNDTRS